MSDQEDTNSLEKTVFDDNDEERKTWTCLGQSCSRPLIVFLSQFFVIILSIFGLFWRTLLSKIYDQSTVWIENLCSAARYVWPSPRIWTSFFQRKIALFISLFVPSQTAKSQLNYKWLKIGCFQPNFDKIYCFYQHSQSLHDVMEKRYRTTLKVKGLARKKVVKTEKLNFDEVLNLLCFQS